MYTMEMVALVTFAWMTFAYLVKHFVCDFVIQMNRRDNMKKFDRTGWVGPLATHSIDHGVGTFIVLFTAVAIHAIMGHMLHFPSGLSLTMIMSALISFDVITHFIIDRLKASPNFGGRFGPEQKAFWMLLGLDQMLHGLVHLSITAVFVTYVYQYATVSMIVSGA